MIERPDKRLFHVHDVSEFPIVQMRSDAVRPGYGPQWVGEMDLLISAVTPFALIYPKPPFAEDHEDFKLRGLWMKTNRDRLATQCRAVLWVVADKAERDTIRAQSVGAQKAFGVPIEAFATLQEATTRAWELLFREQSPLRSDRPDQAALQEDGTDVR